MKTNQTPPHTINQGSIIGDGSGNTINNGLSSRAVVGIALLILMAIAVAFYISNKKEQPKSSLAYHFLVDVSENMNQTINGISLYGIAKQVIHNLSSFGGFDTSRTLRGLRFVGGGDSCNQTSFVGLGTDVSPDKLTHALNQVSPSGVNAYELGLSEAFTDLAKVDANIKIIFIMLGSVSNAPCREYSLPIMLRSYIGSEQDIKPIICTFAIVEDDLAFENFQRQMIADGFSCVYQSSDPNDITQVAIDIIEGLILGERQEKEFIISPPPPTEIIYLAPTSTPQSTTIAEASIPITDTPAPTDTEIPITPTNTEVATNTQTAISSETATPTATETLTAMSTDTNVTTSTATNTTVPLPTDEPTQEITSTDTPSPTIEYISEDVTITVNVPSANGANLRTGPGTNYSRAGFAPNGAVFPVIARTEDSEWYLIDDNNRQLWIFGEGGITSYANSQIQVVLTIPPTPNIIITPTTADLTINMPNGIFCNGQTNPSSLYEGYVGTLPDGAPLYKELGPIDPYLGVAWIERNQTFTVLRSSPECVMDTPHWYIRSSDGQIGYIRECTQYGSGYIC